MRKININGGYCKEEETETDRWAQFSEQCGGDEKIRDAIGYLSLWNWSTFPHVNIVLMGNAGQMELIASYYKEEGGQLGYVIAAIWHGDHFGFHS